MSDEPDADPLNADPLNEGLHHLESAARELIEAGRSFLDAVEGAIGGSDGVEGLLRAFTGRREEDTTEADVPPEDPLDDGYEDIPVD